jgi:hypothetical protein
MKRFSKQDLATFEFCLRKLPRIALAAAVGIAMMLPPVLGVAHAQGGASPALAASPNFSLLGLALNQSLRINVVAPTAQPGFPPNPCSAALSFLDTNRNSVGPNKSVNLNPGQSASLDLNANALLQRFGQRAEVRPIAITYPPSPCIVSAEVFDNFTAFSILVVPATAVLVAPGPSEIAPSPAQFGMQGPALGQVSRLNVAAYAPNPAYPPDPCVASLGFADRNGNAVGPVTTVGLNPGQSASLDLNSSTVITNLGISSFALFGQRVEVRPVVTLVQTSAVNACQASAEVYDTFTGRTWSYAVPPGPNE